MQQEASIIILCLRHTQQRFSQLFKPFLEVNPLLLGPQIKRQREMKRALVLESKDMGLSPGTSIIYHLQALLCSFVKWR